MKILDELDQTNSELDLVRPVFLVFCQCIQNIDPGLIVDCVCTMSAEYVIDILYWWSNIYEMTLDSIGDKNQVGKFPN